MKADVLFRCPRTGREVQVRLGETFEHGRETYKPMECPACDSVHLVKPSDGTLDEEEEE